MEYRCGSAGKDYSEDVSKTIKKKLAFQLRNEKKNIFITCWTILGELATTSIL